MIAALILLTLGGLLLWLGWRNRQRVLASMAWPSVPGRVTASSVREEFRRGNTDTPDSSSYVPVVQYEYQVGTQMFKGHRVSFQDKVYDSAKTAFRAVQAFQVGTAVAVFYDPGNPSSCVLERKAYNNSTPIVVGVILVLGGIVMLVKR